MSFGFGWFTVVVAFVRGWYNIAFHGLVCVCDWWLDYGLG